jgi:hypothetical protein
MPRENAEAKARRLLGEARLTVLAVERDRISARCRGDSGSVYWCGWSPAGWWCRCEARTPWCSHLRALRLVTLVDVRQEHAVTEGVAS